MKLLKRRMVSWELKTALSLRARIAGLEIVQWILALLSILDKLNQNRRATLRVVRLLARLCRPIGGVASTLVGLSLLGLFIPEFSFVFVQASINSPTPASLAIYSFTWLWATGLFGICGIATFGGGLWLAAPNSRVGKWGQRLVVTHVLTLFKSRPSRRGSSSNFSSRSCFGLWHSHP
jgi:hypothetical protein